MDFTSFMQGAMLGGGNSGGGGGGGTDIFTGVVISAAKGVSPITNSVENGIGSFSASESSAGYEGFNIALPNLTVGTSYTINFDFQYTDAAWFEGYRSGVRILGANYVDYEHWEDWPENIDRDLLKHNHQMTFTATAATMYLSFNVCGLSDARTNYFEITDFYVRETSQ